MIVRMSSPEIETAISAPKVKDVAIAHGELAAHDVALPAADVPLLEADDEIQPFFVEIPSFSDQTMDASFTSFSTMIP